MVQVYFDIASVVVESAQNVVNGVQPSLVFIVRVHYNPGGIVSGSNGEHSFLEICEQVPAFGDLAVVR